MAIFQWSEMARSSVCTPEHAQDALDTADIVCPTKPSEAHPRSQFNPLFRRNSPVLFPDNSLLTNGMKTPEWSLKKRRRRLWEALPRAKSSPVRKRRSRAPFPFKTLQNPRPSSSCNFSRARCVYSIGDQIQVQGSDDCSGSDALRTRIHFRRTARSA